jgi:hypothetical protein
VSSVGADISGGSDSIMNSTQHDELAQLFAQNMQLSYQAAQQTTQQQPLQQLQPQEVMVEHVPSVSEKQEPMHFVSSHYTGTAHLRPETTSEPSRSPPPPYDESIMPEAMAEMLQRHSIDPSALLPNQVHLFANADYEQRLRLLELWRISPPSYPLEQHLQNKWQPTSVAQEENDARVRYEHRLQGRLPPQEEHMLDTTIPISPIREAGDPAWPPAARMRAASIAAKRKSGMDAEPYMMNGYQSQQSVDPVYAAAAGLWQAPSYAQAMEQHGAVMENQYGMYEQIRNHADWEAMNERMARDRFVGMHGPSQDEEMEL